MKKPSLTTILSAFAIFVISLILLFPFENLKGYVFNKIYSLTHILIVADSMTPSFFGWPGISIKNVNVTVPLGDTEIELASEKLTFKVGLWGILSPVPAASMNLANLKKGGDLYVKFGQSGKEMRVNLEAESVNLEQLTLPEMTEQLQGLISSTTSVRIDQGDLAKSQGKIELKGENLKTPAHMIEGMPGLSFLIPGMKIGNLEGQINIRNGVVEFTQLKFGSPQADLSGSISGDIRLGQDFQRSTINITVRLQLSGKILSDPQAKTFVSFLEGYQSNTPGDYAMRWNAMVSELTGFSVKVLPDKVPH